jgi:hypothetical protein
VIWVAIEHGLHAKLLLVKHLLLHHLHVKLLLLQLLWSQIGLLLQRAHELVCMIYDVQVDSILCLLLLRRYLLKVYCLGAVRCHCWH